MHQIEILPGNKRFVRVRRADPLGGRTEFRFLDLVMGRPGFALDQRPGIGFVGKDAENRRRGPPAILSVRVVVPGMGKAAPLLVGQRREDAEAVQLTGDLCRAHAAQPHPEDILYHRSGVGIGDQFVPVFLRFQVSVHRERSDEIPVPALHVEGGPGLDGDIPAVGFVHDVLDGDREVVAALFAGGVDVVRDGDEADAVGRENPAQIPPGLDVLPPQPGQILDDDAVDLSGSDVVHHILVGGTVEEETGVPVVHFFLDQRDIRIPGDEILDDPALIAHAVALGRAVVGVGEADIGRRFVL